ncbi:MAG TPA: hypothetical protein PKH77_14930 [Anaerolineae bacterium]|nr:hypothetical protein [Anaerolineae bacterium]
MAEPPGVPGHAAGLYAGGDFINIEVICTDQSAHQARVEQRESDIAGFTLPTWAEIQAREYQDWQRDRIVMDTSYATAPLAAPNCSRNWR